jgi:hypothetical protein
MISAADTNCRASSRSVSRSPVESSGSEALD